MTDQHTLSIAFELVKICADWIGQEGPFTLDMRMLDHNDELKKSIGDYMQFHLDDDLFVCKNYDGITSDDINEFINSVQWYLTNDKFNNGCKYYFEGIEQNPYKENTFILYWSNTKV